MSKFSAKLKTAKIAEVHMRLVVISPDGLKFLCSQEVDHQGVTKVVRRIFDSKDAVLAHIKVIENTGRDMTGYKIMDEESAIGYVNANRKKVGMDPIKESGELS